MYRIIGTVTGRCTVPLYCIYHRRRDRQGGGMWLDLSPASLGILFSPAS